MNEIRPIDKIWKSRPTMEGAGVRLKRAFGYNEVPLLDPFLMLDDFHSNNPADYRAGFPWHPHRGIETVTYMIDGYMKHEDSIGNKGIISSGDAQWMTAGSGIIHSEMPGQESGLLRGMQLWVNLPAKLKMTDPRYRDVSRDSIPSAAPARGITVRVIAGEVNGVKGPVNAITANPHFLDVAMEPRTTFEHTVVAGHTALAYVLEGSGTFSPDNPDPVEDESLVLFGSGNQVRVSSGEKRLRFIFLSGKPIGEPVAWQGPIVMNTDEELRVAFEEYQNGTFLRHRR